MSSVCAWFECRVCVLGASVECVCLVRVSSVCAWCECRVSSVECRVCVQVRAYISTFNLRGDAQEKRVKDLSGGERNRVYMARQLKEVSEECAWKWG